MKIREIFNKETFSFKNFFFDFLFISKIIYIKRQKTYITAVKTFITKIFQLFKLNKKL